MGQNLLGASRKVSWNKRWIVQMAVPDVDLGIECGQMIKVLVRVQFGNNEHG